MSLGLFVEQRKVEMCQQDKMKEREAGRGMIHRVRQTRGLTGCLAAKGNILTFASCLQLFGQMMSADNGVLAHTARCLLCSLIMGGIF